MPRRIRLERLVGCKVFGPDGRPVGRLEDVVVRRRGAIATIVEYHVGWYGPFQVLAGGGLGRALLTTLPFSRPMVYRVPWDDMDRSDVDRPRLVRRELEDFERRLRRLLTAEGQAG